MLRSYNTGGSLRLLRQEGIRVYFLNLGENRFYAGWIEHLAWLAYDPRDNEDSERTLKLIVQDKRLQPFTSQALH